MLKNKKGFTLIEILAAVTILGILTAIAVVSVTKIIEKAKKEHYVTAENNVKSAAQSYAQQRRSVLPKAVGQTTKIYLKELKDNKYIDKVLDYNKNECYKETSYVQIFKYSQNDYSYVTYLDCPGYNSKDTMAGVSPKIDINFNTEAALDEEKAMANITILGSEEEDINLMSYSYKIYRNVQGAGGTEVSKEVKSSGDIIVKGKKSVTINLSLEDYTPGKIKIEVTATNIYGMTKTASASSDFKDTKKPECIIEDEDLPTAPKDWIKADRKITIKCNDGVGSGCVRDEYSKTFKTTMKNGKIRITDNSGNYTDCEVSVYIDKTPPTVPTVTMYKWNSDTTAPTSATELSEYKSGWVNKNIYVVPSNSKDKHVGEFVYQYQTRGDTQNYTNKEATRANVTKEGISEIQWRACDKLGNCSEYSTVKTIKLDKTAPTPPQVKMYKWKNNDTRPTTKAGLTEYESGKWSNRKIYTEPTGSTDALSGVKEHKFTTKGETDNKTNSVAGYRNIEAEGISYIKWKACDKAGNCSENSAQQTIKIDTKAPKCEVSGGSTTWINKTSSPQSRTITAHCVDEGESDCATADFSYTYSTNINTTKAGAKGNNSGGSVKDKAGNETSCAANQTVKIDKEPPTCEVKGGNATWINKTSSTQSRTITAHCTDEGGSTCATADFSYTYSTNINTTTAGAKGNNSGGSVKDKAGNETSCAANQTVKIDKEPPKCEVKGGSTTWINKTSSTQSRTITAHCTDEGGSACATSDFSYTYSEDMNITTAGAKGNKSGGSVKDKAGNETSCAANQTVKIDKTAPSCTNSGDSTTWTNSSRTIKYGCSDSTSKCDTNYSGGSKKFSTTTTTSTIPSYTIKDNAGNSTTCGSRTANVYVDTTDPTCTSEGDSTTWTTSDRTIKYGCQDSHSGCNTSYDGGSKKFSSTTKTATIASYEIRDKAGNSKTCSSRTANVYVDKTAPSCGTITGGSTTWTKNNRTVSVACSDSNGSGCTQTSYSKSYSSGTTKTDTITIKDSLGNSKNCSVNVYVDKEAPNAPTNGSIGAVSGSSTTASIKTASSNTTDVNNGSGFKEIRYVIKTTNSTPSASEFTSTSKSYPRACGQTNYAWSAAVDNVGNVSAIKSLGSSSDGANTYSSWGSCSKKCGGGTQTRTNSCALITTGLSRSCSTQDCCSSTTTTWGSYNTCSKKCGGGTQKRTGTKYSTYDGSSCGTVSESRSCNTQDCCDSTKKANCTSWKWSTCTKKCGGGTQYESRKCDLVSTYDNSVVCTSQKTEKRNKNTSCNTQDCCSSFTRKNCTSWKWSTCTETCGGGTKYQYRKCDHISDYDSSVCASQKTQKRNTGTACNTQSCFSCDIPGETLFGKSKGSISGNSGAWVNANQYFSPNWCHSNGRTCWADGGNQRICIHESCKDLNGGNAVTAVWLNNNKGCSYAQYWCSC